MAALDQLFSLMAEYNSSDLHISAGSPPIFRIHGDLVKVRHPELSHDEAFSLIAEIMSTEQKDYFADKLDIDFAYWSEAGGRFRCNVFMQRKGIGAVFRLIPTQIASLAKLGMPDILYTLVEAKKGLILVVGPTGSGKSTTLAAMIDYINENRQEHIMTIEDPIEFVHENKKCLVNQREVGTHTDSFTAAIRAALREDPDIILVGEMRDLETISLAITAAETGHLVFGTLHTQSATKTVDRIIDAFPQEQQDQIRVQLAETLKSVVSQMLIKKTDGNGRVAAVEVMVTNPAISNLIREGKTYQLPSIIQTGKSEGMIAFDNHLMQLVNAKKISAVKAYEVASNKKVFLQYMSPEEKLEVGVDEGTASGII